jgi:hypothetical protein
MIVRTMVFCTGLAWLSLAPHGLCEEAANDLRSEVSDSRAWYLAVKGLSKDELFSLLSEDWVVESEGKQTLWQVVRWLAFHDSEKAADWLKAEPSRSTNATLWRAVSTGWSEKDPDEAWAFLQTIDPDLYEPAVNGFARGLMMRNVDEGLAFLDDMEEAGLSRNVLDTIGLECGERDAAKGFVLLERLQRQRDVDVFAQTFLQRLAQSSPEKAANAVVRVKDPTIRAKLLDDISSAWARKDLNAARAWKNANSAQ